MTVGDEDMSGRRRPGRPRRSDTGDTKVVLQRAALRLFARQGYAGTSVRAIARDVGLSESVLYAHFDSKQAIFDAVLGELGPRVSVDAVEGMPSDLAVADPPRYLRELVRAFVDEWDNEDARLLISLMARDGLLHSRALQDALSAMRTSTAELFDRWIADGLISETLGSPQDLALSFTGPIGLTRILHLHAEATAHERAMARDAIVRHVDTFARAVFR